MKHRLAHMATSPPTVRRSRRLAVTVLPVGLVLAALVATAPGHASVRHRRGAARALAVKADPNAGQVVVTLKPGGASTSSTWAVAGPMTITIVNKGKAVETLTVGKKHSPAVKPGKRVAWSVTLPPGKYTYTAGPGQKGKLTSSRKLHPLADGFPDSPITLWATFPVGHSDDLLNREVAKVAATYSPQRLVTANDSPGPGLAYSFLSFLATQPRANQGYQIYTANYAALSVKPYQVAAIKNDDISQLHPIAGIQSSVFAFAVPNNSQFTTLAQVVAYARANPNKLRFVSGSPTSRGTVQMIAWEAEAGIHLTFVPASDDTQAQTTALGGGAEIYGTGIHNIPLGEFRILAVTGPTRLNILPKVPTMKELGYHSVLETASNYYAGGYFSLPTVPASHQQWIRDLLRKVVGDSGYDKYYSYADNELLSPAQVTASEHQIITTLYPFIKALGLATKPLAG